jgi:small-conductance mechanosensitive channel
MIDHYDVLAVAGLGILGYGLSRISISLALCVIGGVLLMIGILGAWRKGAGG